MRYREVVLPLFVAALALSCRRDPSQASSPELTAPAPQPAAPQGSAPNPPAGKEKTPPQAESASLGLPRGSLPPAVQRSLEKIRVLRLRDDILDVVWTLKDTKNDYSIIVLDCSPHELSTSRVKALVDWAKQGHGLFIHGRHVGPFRRALFPPPFYLENVPRPSDGSAPELAQDNELVRDVSYVNNYLWCASTKESLRLRAAANGEAEESPGTAAEPIAALAELGGEWIPVLVDPSRPQRASYFLAASRYERARVVWYAGNVNFSNKECQPQYDDVRLWSNLMHWLASEE